MRILIAIACLVVIAISAVIVGIVLPQRRSRRLERKARELGFSFATSAAPFQRTNVAGFSLLPDGPASTVENFMEQAIGNCRFLIFDVPLVDDSANLVSTVAAFCSPGFHLPVFQIAVRSVIERMFEKTGKALGKKQIVFTADSDFASRFSVGCSDPNGLQNLLTPAKLVLLRDYVTHFRIESSPDWLFIYRYGYRVEAEDLAHFRDVTVGIASVLLSLERTQYPTAA